MLKKLVVLGVAGLMGMFLMVGSSYGRQTGGGNQPGGGGCGGGQQDQCEASPTLQATIGMDVKLDFDVCVEWPEDLCGYNGCEQAIIAQKGHGNYGVIHQTGENFALIYQDGNQNWAYAYQDVIGGALALIFQNGNSNGASVTQNAAASALVYQQGNSNIGIISQQ
jgi:hypothetical protein